MVDKTFGQKSFLSGFLFSYKKRLSCARVKIRSKMHKQNIATGLKKHAKKSTLLDDKFIFLIESRIKTFLLVVTRDVELRPVNFLIICKYSFDDIKSILCFSGLK